MSRRPPPPPLRLFPLLQLLATLLYAITRLSDAQTQALVSKRGREREMIWSLIFNYFFFRAPRPARGFLYKTPFNPKPPGKKRSRPRAPRPTSSPRRLPRGPSPREIFRRRSRTCAIRTRLECPSLPPAESAVRRRGSALQSAEMERILPLPLLLQTAPRRPTGQLQLTTATTTQP